MSNGYYNATGNPQFLSRESSAQIQQEFSSIQTGFGKLPADARMIPNYVIDTGAPNAYAITLVPAPAGYVDGMVINFFTTNANTGASTVNVNALGAVPLVNLSAFALQANDIINPSVVSAMYKGGSFYLLSANDRGWVHGETWTGTHNFTGATISVATQAALNNSTDAASTAYADSAVAVEKARALGVEATLMPYAGGAFTGAVTVQAPTASGNPTTKNYTDSTFMPLAGGAFTGAVTVQAPTSSYNPATKTYVDSAIYSGGAAPVWVSGSTYTYGNVVFSPANFQTYRHVTASSAGTTDPSLDATNWAEVGGGGVLYLTYDNRGQLRSTPSSNGAQAVVDGIGLFIFSTSSTATDDDETAFAATGGVWLLEGASWDAAFAYWLPDYWDNLARIEDLESGATVPPPVSTLQTFQAKFLESTFSMTITSLASAASSSFTATVAGANLGDTVIVTPGNYIGPYVTFSAWVSAANTVTVELYNPSATSATLTASTWAIRVINQ
ncbi:MAG: hypothetical protein KGI47_10075 [Betaproteobacteria bacterium]|nr:hypothetical protein [Betaproteobacteria bacterium]